MAISLVYLLLSTQHLQPQAYLQASGVTLLSVTTWLAALPRCAALEPICRNPHAYHCHGCAGTGAAAEAGAFTGSSSQLAAFLSLRKKITGAQWLTPTFLIRRQHQQEQCLGDCQGHCSGGKVYVMER